MHQTGIRDRRVLEVERDKVGKRFEIGQSGVSDLRARKVQVNERGNVFQHGQRGIGDVGPLHAKIRILPNHVHGDGPHSDPQGRQLVDGALFSGTRLEFHQARQRRRRRRINRFRRGFFGPDRTLVDPITDQFGLHLGERVGFARHEIFMGRSQRDAPVEIALVGLAGFDDFAIFAALEGRLLRVETQFAFLLLLAVALEAGLAEDGFDVLREIHFLFGLGVENRGANGARQDYN